MPNPPPAFRRLQRLSVRLREAENRADLLREQLRDEIAAARASGMTVTDIGKALGVTRQRAQQLIRKRGNG